MDKRFVAGIFAVLALGAPFLLRYSGPEPTAPAREPSIASARFDYEHGARAMPAALRHSAAAGALLEPTAQDRRFIAEMRARYASLIATKPGQVELIEHLMAYVLTHHPEGGRGLVAAFLQQSFPDAAEDMFDTFQRLVRYNDWLRAQREALRQMTDDERQVALRQAQREAFGADAEVIWPH